MAEGAEWVAGLSVRVLTKHTQEEVGGTVFGYDPVTDVVMIKEQGTHGGVVNLRLYKAAQLKVLSAEYNSDAKQLAAEPLPYVDKDRARQREDKALQQAELDMAKVGIGVTKEAQGIFDALSKTMPCIWHDRSITVMDVVTVKPPYTVADVSAAPEQSGALERVKKVLAAERVRMGLAVA